MTSGLISLSFLPQSREILFLLWVTLRLVSPRVVGDSWSQHLTETLRVSCRVKVSIA